MKYVLLMMANIDGPGCEPAAKQKFIDFDDELNQAGVLAGGFVLDDPEHSTSVVKASREAEPVVTTGPYAETREFVGGTYIIDVANLDEALAWAAKCPGAIGGRVEIRPLVEY